MSALGSYAWGARHGGQLTTRDRLAYIKAALWSRVKRAAGISGARVAAMGGPLDLHALEFPDSRVVRRVMQVCEQAYPAWLLNHCLRTYLWGGLVAQRERLRFDREELLVASLCHDLGLTNLAGLDAECECFAVRGARYADGLLTELGANHLAPRVADSVAMHLNIQVDRHEPLAYLLHQGASIDVVGWGAAKVAEQRQQVLARHPHLGFAAALIPTLDAEARAHAGGRLALMVRFGFFDLIARQHQLT
jgi:hypothetical protein